MNGFWYIAYLNTYYHDQNTFLSHLRVMHTLSLNNVDIFTLFTITIFLEDLNNI